MVVQKCAQMRQVDVAEEQRLLDWLECSAAVTARQSLP